MTAPHLESGRQGELYARRWLEERGLTHVCSNYRCRFGELDLVMRDQGCLVIVEVRFRRRNSYGGALLSISPAKRARLAKAALMLIKQHRALRAAPLRFDVMALSGEAGAPVVDWRKNAFSFDSD